jgi:hypothetical protein
LVGSKYQPAGRLIFGSEAISVTRWNVADRVTRPAQTAALDAAPSPPRLTLDSMDMDDWAADSAEKIAQATKQANPLAFQIPDGATEDEAVTALRQHAQEHGLRVPDDDEARQLIRRTRQGTQGG